MALDERTEQVDTELEEIVHFYLTSADFNGYPVSMTLPTGWKLDNVRALVSNGLVQVVTVVDYPNPHIRPWPSRRSPDDQIADVEAAVSGAAMCCLYPAPKAMQARDLSAYTGRPFAETIALGRGHLELAFFEMAAIEPYRNDARYNFEFSDFGLSFGISDLAFLDADEPDQDKIHSLRVGFGFPKGALTDPSQVVRRYACIFYFDLARLTPRHQQRLATWLVEGQNLSPHPSWWSMQMGEWGDHIGPFEKVLHELAAINAVWKIAFGKALFRNTSRPRDWGWVLRPDTNEWGTFVLATDKLISENLAKDGLDAAGARAVDDSGNQLGSLGRLEWLLINRTTLQPDDVRSCLRPWRQVRRERQRPAHATTSPYTDQTIYSRQRELLENIAISLEALRIFLSRHPKVVRASWSAPKHLQDWLSL